MPLAASGKGVYSLYSWNFIFAHSNRETVSNKRGHAMSNNFERKTTKRHMADGLQWDRCFICPSIAARSNKAKKMFNSAIPPSTTCQKRWQRVRHFHSLVIIVSQKHKFDRSNVPHYVLLEVAKTKTNTDTDSNTNTNLSDSVIYNRNVQIGVQAEVLWIAVVSWGKR